VEKHSLVVDETLPMDSIPKWFLGSKLNFAQNILKRNDQATAIIGCGEEVKTFLNVRECLGLLPILH
jgi:acetoacetyl-CoA synthetase